MPFILPELEFKYDALEPNIDAKTMELHYRKHHAGYLKKLNKAIEGTELENFSSEEILDNVSKYSDTIRNNAGGYYNHSFFWQILTPGNSSLENVELTDAINKYFGTFDKLKEEFTSEALNLFGSGWTWLIKKDNGELLVYSTANQDNPLMDITPIKGKPLLCVDVWEHAYYLKYQNNRAAYLQSFWNIIDWNKVAELYNE